MKRFKGFLGSLVFVLVLSFTIGGVLAIPQIMSYQGKLTDSAGNPITGSRSVLFTIYDASSSGTDLWNETRTVSVSKGIYSLNLGEVTPIPTSVFNGSDRWLGIKVASDSEMTPRLKLASVGNAYRSYDSDNLGGVAASGYIASSGGTMTGPLTLEGGISSLDNLKILGTLTIGDINPGQKLMVAGEGNAFITVLRGTSDSSGGFAIGQVGQMDMWDIYTPLTSNDLTFSNIATGRPSFKISASTDAVSIDNNLTIGGDIPNIDHTLTFRGDSNTGTITWKEDENYFSLSKGATFEGTVKGTTFYGSGSGLTNVTVNDWAITTTKIATNAVTANSIASLAVAAADIANNTITGGKLSTSIAFTTTGVITAAAFSGPLAGTANYAILSGTASSAADSNKLGGQPASYYAASSEYVMKTGDTMTGPLTVEGAISGSVESRFGDASRYWKVELLDLTDINPAYKYYPMFSGYSDGAAGNLGAIKNSLIVAGIGVDPSLMFFDDVGHSSATLSYDVGNTRFNFNGSANFSDPITLNDSLTFSGTPQIIFTGGGKIDEFADGSGNDIRLNSRRVDALSTPFFLSAPWHLSGMGSQYWDTVDAGAGDEYLWQFRQFTDYQQSGNAGSGQVVMTPSGIIVGNGFADKDYYLRFLGQSNTGNIYWMEDEDHFSFTSSVSVDGSAYVSGPITTESFVSAAEFYGDGSNLSGIGENSVSKSGDTMTGPLTIESLITCEGLTMGLTDTDIMKNRIHMNEDSAYNNNAVISAGGGFTGAIEALGSPYNTPGLFSSQIYSQAKNDGSGTYYTGIWAKADANRNPAEAVAIAGEAYGSGATGLFFGGGASDDNIGMFAQMKGYANNCGLSVENNGTGGGLVVRADSTDNDIANFNSGGADILQVQDDMIIASQDLHLADGVNIVPEGTGYVGAGSYFAVTGSGSGDKIYFNGYSSNTKISGGGTGNSPNLTFQSDAQNYNNTTSFVFNNYDALSGSNCKLMSFQNGGSEEAFIDSAGGASFTGNVSVEGDLAVGDTGDSNIIFSRNGDNSATISYNENDDILTISSPAVTVGGILTVNSDLVATNNATVQMDLSVEGNATVEGNVNVKGELLGARELMSFCRQSITAAGYMLTAGTANPCSATYGKMMPRSGSIVGFTGMISCTAVTPEGNVISQVRVNDVTKASVTTNITATGVYSFYETYPRGTYTFSAGQFFDPYMNFSGGFGGTINKSDYLIEVVFDN